MLKTLLIMCGVLVALVNCSSDNEAKVSLKTIPSDTPTEIIDSNGKVVDTIQPEQKPEPTVDGITKELWTKLGFTQKFLMAELVGADICSISEKQYVGCFFVAQSASAFLHGEDTILVVDGQVDEDLIGGKIAEIGPFAVHKRKSRSKTGEPRSAKMENDFFKDTVRAVTAVYKKEIAELSIVKESNERLLKAFPEGQKKLKVAAETKDNKAGFEQAKLELNEVLRELTEIKTILDESIYKDYNALIDAAFAKMPEENRALNASHLYGTYLRHSADGHARVELNKDILNQFTQNVKGSAANFGVGITILETKEGVFLEPLENSPSMKAGMLPNDRVVAVDGVVISGIDSAIAMIKGALDTEVSITVERWETKQHFTYTMKRQPLQLQSFVLSQKSENGKNYGVLKINSFMDDTMASAVRAYITKNDKSVDGWILDLRGNPGGLLTQAVELLSAFLPKGSATVAHSSSLDPDVMDRSTMQLTQAAQVTEKNIVVSINEGSASASEVVAGVLQEYKRALVIGNRSFGKGSVQQAHHEFHPDVPTYSVWNKFNIVQNTLFGQRKVPAVIFWKTIGRYFYPSGRTPEWVGVEPDVTVSPNPEVPEVFAAREKDVFPFSFGDLSQPWVQTRATLVSQVQACVNTSAGVVTRWSTEETKKPFSINYQTLFAYDALKCM